jgi:hypothetical protein
VARDAAEAHPLIGALNRELDERYPEEAANHFRTDPQEVAPALLEAGARHLGAQRLEREAGERQFESAAADRQAGCVAIERFGEYVNWPLSRCRAQALA